MAEHLYPTATISSTDPTLAVVGAASIFAALDSDTASYVNGSGRATFVVAMAPPTMAADQLASITVEFDARPQASWQFNTLDPLVGELRDSRTGTVYARSTWTPDKTTPFRAAQINFGTVVSQTVANNLWLWVFMPGGDYAERWEINDARMTVTDLFDPPTATATGPSGVINDNTPTFHWTATVDADAFELYGRWRVFTAAQYGAGGFDPETSPPLWDSGLRAITTHSVTSIPLTTGSYRAYVAAYQKVVAGQPWSARPGASSSEAYPLHAGAFASFVAFSIVPAAPDAAAPTIPLDVVRDLTEEQRATLLEQTRPVPRVQLFTADGVFVRELTIITPSPSKVTLDSRSQVRGTLDLVVGDVDIVPATRAEASGESQALHPFGSYVHVSYGLRDGRFGTVYVGVGVFRLTSVKRDLRSGKVTVKGRDFSLNVQESRVAYPTTRQSWDTTPPTPFFVVDTARLLIAETGIASRIGSSATRVALNYGHKIGDDRLAALDQLAASIDGWTWYADIDGVIVFGPGPDITSDALSYTLATGDPEVGRLTAQIIGREQELTRDDVFDVVVAYDDAVQYIGGAYDTSPDSVIKRSAANPAALLTGSGTFSPGGKPFFYSSPTVASNPNAQSAAQLRMRDVALPAEAISATCNPIPDLRPDKMVAMARDGETALVKWQVVKAIVPLTIGPLMEFEAVTLADDVVPAS